MKSTIGRPRTLTDEQVTIILAWHERYMAWKALRAALKTQRQLARELGVSPSTIAHVIACRGQFKQPSPEKRSGEIKRRGRRIARLRARGLA